ncbi:TPA: hypothetical protein ACG320_005200 [Escherichia coli]|uniref:hypothetical protein n=1 Tax=Escherichia coli TaxID=562 RepID=UPI001D033628|nr:hypothetical protein [Escherichia coli]MCV8357282.1 hypothetical protein [Escherichia coli]MCV8761522.1 hypothetical protein [Escherichia coli]MCV9007292.1 hypothetical protein [Escherichia coli]MCV9313694.1 hypothetical protein [Escherichia coli]MCW9986792.1 hypothetical protein [Escherichia coli]
MLKRRDAFLKKSALAVSVALLLSAQAQAVLTGPVDANSSSLLIGENSFITNSTGTANNTFLLGGGAFNMDSPGSLQFGSFSECIILHTVSPWEGMPVRLSQNMVLP